MLAQFERSSRVVCLTTHLDPRAEKNQHSAQKNNAQQRRTLGTAPPGGSPYLGNTLYKIKRVYCPNRGTFGLRHCTGTSVLPSS